MKISPSHRGKGGRKKEMKKQELEKGLMEILDILRTDNEEYYKQEAENHDWVRDHMTPSEMTAYKCGKIQAKIEWMLTH